MIYVFVYFLFAADIIFAMEFKVAPLEIGTSGTIRCGHGENDPTVNLVQWYKRERIDEFENGEASLAWWKEGKSGSLQNYHMENTTFSLVIGKATFEDEGIYQCSVIRGDLLREKNYYTQIVMYVLPRRDPNITLDTDLNLVNCTVEHVKPVIYPVFNFDWRPDITETSAVPNEDGTHTTSVSCTLPPNKSALRVDCYFSYLYYQRVGSLVLRDIATDSMIENESTTGSPMATNVTCAGHGYNTIDHSPTFPTICLVLSTLINFVVCIMFMYARRQYYRVLRMNNETRDNDEKMIQPAIEMVA